MAHYLPIEKKILILNSLVEGNSICSTGTNDGRAQINNPSIIV